MTERGDRWSRPTIAPQGSPPPDDACVALCRLPSAKDAPRNARFPWLSPAHCVGGEHPFDGDVYVAASGFLPRLSPAPPGASGGTRLTPFGGPPPTAPACEIASLLTYDRRASDAAPPGLFSAPLRWPKIGLGTPLGRFPPNGVSRVPPDALGSAPHRFAGVPPAHGAAPLHARSTGAQGPLWRRRRWAG